jgi:hypothetical protein
MHSRKGWIKETGGSMIAIDQMKPGLPPADFTIARTGQEGQWTVVDHPTATTGRTIQQSSTRVPIIVFPLAIADNLSALNLNVELRFKALAGRNDQPAASLCGSRMMKTATSIAVTAESTSTASCLMWPVWYSASVSACPR